MSDSLKVSSCVSNKDYRPYVQFELHGQKFQLTPAEARKFAADIVEASIHSLMDSTLVNFLQLRVGIDETVNIAAILNDFRIFAKKIDELN